MPYLTEKVVSLVHLQNNTRPGWNSDKQFIGEYIKEEAKEGDEALEKVYLGDGPMEFAGEFGDVLYLGVEYLRDNPNPGAVPLEVMRAYYRTLETALDLGLDPNDAVLMKVFRNDLKYPHIFSNNGFKDIQEVKRYSKEQWQIMKGEAAWLHAFMMLGEDITHHE